MVFSTTPLPHACLSLFGILLPVCCLLFPGAQGQALSLQVDPQDPVVPKGGWLLMNCSAKCLYPKKLVLETALSKESVGRGPSWVTYRLLNVTGDSEVICAGFCNGSQITISTNITVYGLPDRVELEPLPLWQPVGKNLTLRCQVWGGAPRDKLTVVLLRGKEELSRQPALGEPAEAMATVLARREDHGTNFSCRTELDLRSRGLELFETNLTSRQLQTFVLPVSLPFLTAPQIVEVGKELTVVCSMERVFPAWEAQVHMALGDQMLNPEVVIHGDMLKATARATVHEEQEGEGTQIVCNVTFGGKSWETRENVTFYSFQGPILNLSKTCVPEGTTVTVTCMAGTQVKITLDGAPVTAPGQPAQLQLNATERDDGRSFSCKAKFEVGGEILHKNKSVQLRVLYGPKIDRAQCPQHLRWKYNSYQVLQCQARGNPTPQLQCLQEVSNLTVPIRTPFLVTLNHNGIYQCQAVSELGTTTIKVLMEVQGRKSSNVPIFMAVLVVLSLVTVATALRCVFKVKTRKGNYRLKHSSTSLPLTSRQPEGLSGEEPS
ncbi:PREDICTED: intercellular adhesion molecule 3 [Chrysochloris asiatica]|uniref:Intercellular adhesion molecule 3 n=1 Tax=Chrysochloris asiatica TaxID=185453 RepID=A0A9B0U861_CHRAS|nr:PREDICTED: intercellular adhesion molecule 3 [Chrysochloris asiatica]